MASTINTNINSLDAQRNLNNAQMSLSTAMQRLSSGMRINSAKDDAAGLAISQRMTTQINGLDQAGRNANDGISLAQTAEGSLGNVSDMLQRMRELAVQAGNATNSSSDRVALQAEVGQLGDEIDRVAKTTTFNGQKILDGSFAGATFQVGANAGDNITVGSIGDAKASELGSIQFAQGSEASLDASTITGYSTAIAAGTLSINIGSTTVTLGAIAAASTGAERLGDVAAAINDKTDDTGVTAFVTAKSDGTFSIEFRSEAMDLSASSPTATSVSLSGFTAANSGVTLTTLAVDTTAADIKGIDSLDVSTQAGAWSAIKKIDDALNTVNASRADLGALESRFDTAVSSIGVDDENLTSARSRITDADFAVETANLSRAQILQQAGTAMVAQANQLPQSVLSLLK